MPHPVFISVASEDSDYARKIKGGFSDDTAYFYEQTGIEGADWPEEIEEEVQFCECFVILWSANYIQKNWTLRELAIAAKRIASKTLRSWLIIQIDDTSLSPRLINPITSLNEDLLSSVRAKYRSVGPPFRVTAAQRAVGNALARVKPSRLPILARTELQNQLREAFSINFRERNPLTFVSGLNGTGRKTLVKCVMESDFGHLTPHLVTLEVADGPDDLLLKLWIDVLNIPPDEVTRQLKALRKGKLNTKVLITHAVKDVASNKGYLIINIDIPNDYVSPIPAWVKECLNDLPIGGAPILFLVIPRRIPEYILTDFHHTALIHVPTLEQHESRDLTIRLIQALDLHSTRWTEKHEDSIVKRGGGNPELIQKLVIMACRQQSLDFIEHQLDPVVEHFLEYLGEWVEHSLTHLGSMREEGILLLSIIDRLGIADLAALSDARLSHSKVASAPAGEVLYKLSNIGLIEQLNDGVFRIPPLVRMKISFHLNKGELGKTVDQCLHNFAEHPLDLGRDENGATFILNALEAKLLSDIELTEQETAYVSAAFMFRAGLQRYWRGDYFHAYRLLHRVFDMRATVNNEDVRLEITRYFGLAAIREEKNWLDVELALKNEFTNSRYKEKSNSMFHFLTAFSHRLNGEYDSACEEYKKAYDAINNTLHNNRQLGTILSEWARSLLNTYQPDFELAIKLANQAYSLSSSPHNLDVLMRALLVQVSMQEGLTDEEVQAKLDEFDKKRAILENKSLEGGFDFHRMRRIDFMEYKANEAKRSGSVDQLDLRSAIQLAREVYDTNHRDDVLMKVWQLTYHNEVNRDMNSLHSEVQQFLDDNPNANKRHRSHAIYWLIYSLDISLPNKRNKAESLFQQYRHTLSGKYKRELNDYLFKGTQRNYRPGLEYSW